MLPRRISRKSDKAEKGRRSPAHPFARVQTLTDPAAFKAWVGSWDDCWLWDGPLNERGYGNFNIGGGKITAHRASYLLFNGPICGGLHVLHSCDVRNCVNPEHLSLGTHADNMADMVAKGRHVAPKGERAPWAKLNAEAVGQILASTESGAILARRFGVSRSSIYNVRNRKTWKDASDAAAQD